MTTPQYASYLSSDHWRDTREQAIERAGGECERCGTSDPPLHVHHLTYERLGREQDDDLEVLCRSCHAEEHPEKLSDDGFSWSIEQDCHLCPSRIAVANLVEGGRIAIQCAGCNNLHVEKRRPGRELGQLRSQTPSRDDAVACVACRSGFQNLYAVSQHHRDKHGVVWEDTPEGRSEDDSGEAEQVKGENTGRAPLPWWHKDAAP